MHGLVSYRRFGRARLLRSDRAEWTLDRYVATELGSSSVATDREERTLGRYVANEPGSTPVASDRAWLVPLGRYDDGEEDSSADEEQPANRRRIEVILSQQTLSSNDENNDTPILGDLRDVLKRKLESEDDNRSEHSDLRLKLNARQSHRISTGDPDPKKHLKRPNGDLRDRLNASDVRQLYAVAK
ncbi:hypothetical protein F2Q70_00039533 [Brassica cretica]|uniref:Uncharacterized protein n=1 Tax=Brassica cretica TaxID=69181 RepID=A0A8S9K2U7_BRACR|nr:hypothetical protein F2Q70_00039533 [Brassica cretica]